MFTGIVQSKRKVVKVERAPGLMKLWVDLVDIEGLNIGASVAINGTCLTAVSISEQGVQFDLIQETLSLTNLDLIKEGDLVNIERAAKVGDEIGGHLVSGHIHTTATILDMQYSENNLAIHLSLANEWKDYVIYKGFICIDGASLTVGKLSDQGFWLHIIPETLRVTTLGDKAVKDLVNIEIDSSTQTAIDTIKQLAKAGDLKRWLS
ncbi:riboflavin synthase subunit alpha [Agarivorans sp. Toyoura001]|uniref:riboflavin synthase subunit alpha n=1 Tax=unclassified Agarivorans TaxID=2636026 RepID=UPI0010F91F7F|nr:riboflavin synthase subunit alpha [Agarivorans sp. Toyoura001]